MFVVSAVHRFSKMNLGMFLFGYIFVSSLIGGIFSFKVENEGMVGLFPYGFVFALQFLLHIHIVKIDLFDTTKILGFLPKNKNKVMLTDIFGNITLFSFKDATPQLFSPRVSFSTYWQLRIKLTLPI